MRIQANKILLIFLMSVSLCIITSCSSISSVNRSSEVTTESSLVDSIDQSEIETEDQTISILLNETEYNQERLIELTVNNHVMVAELVDNSSADALLEILENEDLVVHMRDYGDMEKVGDLGQVLPSNNEQIKTEAGDLILYQGSAFVIYYSTNSYNFTRLGKILDVTSSELIDILGDGDVNVKINKSR